MGGVPGEDSLESLGTREEREVALLQARMEVRARAEAEGRLLVGADFTDTRAMRAELAARGVDPANEELQMSMSLKFNERCVCVCVYGCLSLVWLHQR